MSLEKLRAARTVAGIHQALRAVQNGAAEMVFIASDVDGRVLDPLFAACGDAGIIPDRTATKAALGAAVHLDVGAAAVAKLR
ncbi:MAG: ribosomal L7Ae/L30e/S12e/Gadd45 family protein [Centipeda sp. (in: firmicutes)]|uniref:ribosomal L7Ae/L30e/S12e/Gadd45 family protein n=1 Tax=Selenomonas sp. oral taxon 920 TaxID=1884263 RepID=UPI000840E79B|nr:ribosomal L7Ae/L30e/S12e/Gadd45 family protein [Selenomonas sp. oral taxon 920]AOH48590.1 50S ribosomal protein L7ae [Selenomonas sp. oral taxon 920]